MKKRYLLSLLAALFLSVNCGAQMKLDIPGGRLLADYKALRSGIEVMNPDLRLVGDLKLDSRGSMMPMGEDAFAELDNRIIGAIVTLNPGYTGSDLLLGGKVEITSESAGDRVCVAFPISALEQLTELDAVKLVSVGYRYTPYMYSARRMGNVDNVHSGSGLDRSYKGKNVIVGMFDTGMDPNHLNFKLDNGAGASRVKRVYAYLGSSGNPTSSCETDEQIANFQTDKKSESHGTHVMGIAAGSYNGKGAWYAGSTLTEADNGMPFYGVAPEADIVMAGGELYNVNIKNGVQKLIEYAESQGKPAVINLSLGSLLGPHDGSESICQELAELGKRAIICVAAGNDAGTKNSFLMTGGLSTSTRIIGISNYVKGDPHGIELWSNRTAAFTKLEFVLLNVSTGKIIYSREIGDLGGNYLRLGASGTSSAYEKVAEFDEAFTSTSYITFRTFTYSGNKKYVAEITNHLADGGNLVRPCLRITRARGEEVYGINSGGEFTNHNYTGKPTEGATTYAALVDGNDDGSISSMATGENIITVGAYTSATTFGILGEGWGYGYNGHTEVGEMTSFSSYGRNMETREYLPHVSAPGSAIISSLNSYWNVSGGIYGQSSGTVTKDSKSYYWGPMQGTSMACPFVTGVVALWLEADPNLTVDDIKDIITTTSKTAATNAIGDAADMKRRGAGNINAAEGVKEVLVRKAGIGSVWADDDTRLVLSRSDNALNAFVAGESRLSARLYSIGGAQVAAAAADSQELTISTSGLSKGIYVLVVDGSGTHFTRKVVIR